MWGMAYRVPGFGKPVGRPRLEPGRRRVPLTISLPASQVEFVKAWAFARDWTPSRAIQELILREMARAQKPDIRGACPAATLYRLRTGSRYPEPDGPEVLENE